MTDIILLLVVVAVKTVCRVYQKKGFVLGGYLIFITGRFLPLVR